MDTQEFEKVQFNMYNNISNMDKLIENANNDSHNKINQKIANEIFEYQDNNIKNSNNNGSKDFICSHCLKSGHIIKNCPIDNTSKIIGKKFTIHIISDI